MWEALSDKKSGLQFSVFAGHLMGFFPSGFPTIWESQKERDH
jgi:hypothetical protein